MMKPGAKRRRTAQQIIDDREAKRLKEEEIEQKYAQIQAVEEKYSALQHEAQLGTYSVSVCDNLLKAGILQTDGNGTVRLDPKFKEYQAKHK